VPLQRHRRQEFGVGNDRRIGVHDDLFQGHNVASK
jgi:hypothetical protein